MTQQQQIQGQRQAILQAQKQARELAQAQELKKSQLLSKQRGLAGLAQTKAQAQLKREASRKQLIQIGGQAKQFETQVAQRAPEFATPQQKEKAYQEARKSIQSKVKSLQSLIQQRQSKPPEMFDEKDRNFVQALQSELGVYTSALGGNKDNLIKGHYSGQTSAQATYAKDKTEAHQYQSEQKKSFAHQQGFSSFGQYQKAYKEYEKSLKPISQQGVSLPVLSSVGQQQFESYKKEGYSSAQAEALVRESNRLKMTLTPQYVNQFLKEQQFQTAAVKDFDFATKIQQPSSFDFTTTLSPPPSNQVYGPVQKVHIGYDTSGKKVYGDVGSEKYKPTKIEFGENDPTFISRMRDTKGQTGSWDWSEESAKKIKEFHRNSSGVRTYPSEVPIRKIKEKVIHYAEELPTSLKIREDPTIRGLMTTQSIVPSTTKLILDTSAKVSGEKEGENILTMDISKLGGGIKETQNIQENLINISKESEELFKDFEMFKDKIEGNTFIGSDEEWKEYQKLLSDQNKLEIEWDTQEKRLKDLGGSLSKKGEFKSPTIKKGLFGLTEDVPITEYEALSEPLSAPGKILDVLGETIGTIVGKGVGKLDFDPLKIKFPEVSKFIRGDLKDSFKGGKPEVGESFHDLKNNAYILVTKDNIKKSTKQYEEQLEKSKELIKEMEPKVNPELYLTPKELGEGLDFTITKGTEFGKYMIPIIGTPLVVADVTAGVKKEGGIKPFIVEHPVESVVLTGLAALHIGPKVTKFFKKPIVKLDNDVYTLSTRADKLFGPRIRVSLSPKTSESKLIRKKFLERKIKIEMLPPKNEMVITSEKLKVLNEGLPISRISKPLGESVLNLPTGEKLKRTLFKSKGEGLTTTEGRRILVNLGGKRFYSGIPSLEKESYKVVKERLIKSGMSKEGAREFMRHYKPEVKVSSIKGFEEGKEYGRQFIIKKGEKDPFGTFEMKEIIKPKRVMALGEKTKEKVLTAGGEGEVFYWTGEVTKPFGKVEDIYTIGGETFKAGEYSNIFLTKEKASVLKGRPYTKISEFGKLKTEYKGITKADLIKEGKTVDLYFQKSLLEQTIPRKRGFEYQDQLAFIGKGKPKTKLEIDSPIRVTKLIQPKKEIPIKDIEISKEKEKEIIKTLESIFGKDSKKYLPKVISDKKDISQLSQVQEEIPFPIVLPKSEGRLSNPIDNVISFEEIPSMVGGEGLKTIPYAGALSYEQTSGEGRLPIKLVNEISPTKVIGVSDKVLIKQDVGEFSLLNLKGGLIPKQEFKSISTLKPIEVVKSMLDVKTIPVMDQLPNTRSIQEIMVSQKTMSQQDMMVTQKIMTTPILRTSTQRVYQKPKPLRPKLKIRIPILPRKKTKFVKHLKPAKKLKTGFGIEVRRRGKWERIYLPHSFATREGADARAMSIVQKEAAASYRLVKSKKPAKKSFTKPSALQKFMFRPGKEAGVKVQKKLLRITTPGEVKQISLVGAAARRKKSINILALPKKKVKKKLKGRKI